MRSSYPVAVWILAVLVLLVSAPAEPARAGKMEYPPAPVGDTVDILHGTKVPDPYRWLENEDSEQTRAWVESEAELLRSQLDRFPEKAKLQKRFEYLYDVTSTSSPRVVGDRLFFYRRNGLQDHSVLYVREGSFRAEPKLVIDPNTFSEDGTVALDWISPSGDGGLIAYGKSESGTEKSTLYVRDVTTGKDLDEEIPNTRYSVPAWSADGQSFYYARYPEPGSVPEGDENYHRDIYYHVLGTDWHDDPFVFGEGRPKEEWRSVSTSSDHSHYFLYASLDWTKNDLYIKEMGAKTGFEPLFVGLDGQFGADVYGDRLIVRTDLDAPKFRLLSVPLDDPSPENWKEIVPEGEGVLEGFEIVGDRLVLEYLVNATSRLYVHDMNGKRLGEIELPSLGTVAGLSGRYDGTDVFFTFTSFVQPSTVYRYDVKGDDLAVVERNEVKVDPSRYATEQVWYTSKDGTRVPMFLVYRKGLKKSGDNPTMLYGYGGFEISLTPSFRSSRAVWLDSGGLLAIPNLRGGGEFGREWHEAGRLENKQNVFDDFIAAAEWLIENDYTSRDHLAIYGGSNGGLLVGACLVQRPDLYRAVVCAVPLLDMIRYQKFRIARLWIPEYGSSDDPDQFEYLLDYSPYHNVEAGVEYPATLITTGDSDSRVDPCHARKMAARLQAATAGDLPVLLRVESKAGHGAGMPLSKRLEGTTDIYLFLMWQLGMLDDLPRAALEVPQERAEAPGRIGAGRTSRGDYAVAGLGSDRTGAPVSGGRQAQEDEPALDEKKTGKMKKEREELEIGAPAPSFTLPRINGDEKKVSLSDYEGKITVLWWHSIQCPWVRSAEEGLGELIETYEKKGVEFLAINSNKTEKAEAIAAYDKENSRFPCPILKDAGNVVADAYDARVTPHVFILDEKGNLVYDGALDGRKSPGSVQKENYVTRTLDALLAGKEVPETKTRPRGCTVKRES
jgi:prolyl oligopeptidase